MRYWRLWTALTLVIVGSFAVLGYYGYEIYQKAPPIPERVVSTEGQVLFTKSDIQDGQNVWQSMGGQEVGSIWGHGAYVAPDWSGDWLHREAVWILDRWASQEEGGTTYAKLPAERQAALRSRLQTELRANTYDPQTGDITVSPLRARAIAAVASHYDGLFGDEAELAGLRDAYAIPANSVPDPDRRAKMTAFFFWTSWACVTQRPDMAITYTNNWPADELVGNRPTGSLVVWSVISFVLLLAGIGALSWYFAAQRHTREDQNELPARDPLLALESTPSMKATLKYFWVVAALIVVQIGMGAVTAHYGVEGAGFYGFPLAQWLPYSVTRTWHTQLGIFWIATAWLATGLFIAPAVSGKEPKFQKLGVNFLFVCLLIIVVGSMFGTWLGTRQGMGFTANFWFGHQGYEYVDLGRFWQIFLLVGLFLWLGLMIRAMWPALRKPGEQQAPAGPVPGRLRRPSPLFYAAGLMWGQHTHLAIAEYWRWWVVHLWVEGFFEVFATVVIAFLFTRMGLLQVAHGHRARCSSSTIIFLCGGIIGTFHHLYFTGTPTADPGPGRRLQRVGGGAADA